MCSALEAPPVGPQICIMTLAVTLAATHGTWAVARPATFNDTSLLSKSKHALAQEVSVVECRMSTCRGMLVKHAAMYMHTYCFALGGVWFE